jgi:hypothetical protein
MAKNEKNTKFEEYLHKRSIKKRKQNIRIFYYIAGLVIFTSLYSLFIKNLISYNTIISLIVFLLSLSILANSYSQNIIYKKYSKDFLKYSSNLVLASICLFVILIVFQAVIETELEWIKIVLLFLCIFIISYSLYSIGKFIKTLLEAKEVLK